MNDNWRSSPVQDNNIDYIINIDSFAEYRLFLDL